MKLVKDIDNIQDQKKISDKEAEEAFKTIITWMGEDYERKNGKINYNGEWLPEGDMSFPWEKH